MRWIRTIVVGSALAAGPAAAQTALGEVIDGCVAAVRAGNPASLAFANLREYDGDLLGFADVAEGRVSVRVASESGAVWKCTVAGHDPRDKRTVQKAWLSRARAEPALTDWFAAAGTQPDSALMQMLVPGEHGMASCPPGDTRGWLVTATTQVSFGVSGVADQDLPVWITVNRARPISACERMGR